MLDWISGLAGPGETGCRDAPFAALDDHLIAWRKPAEDCGHGGGRLPELDAVLLRFVVRADREDIIALLVGQDGGARDRSTSTGCTPSSSTVTNSPSVLRAPDRRWWRDHAAVDWG